MKLLRYRRNDMVAFGVGVLRIGLVVVLANFGL